MLMCASPWSFCAMLIRGMLIRGPNLPCERICRCCPDRAVIFCIGTTTVQYSRATVQTTVACCKLVVHRVVVFRLDRRVFLLAHSLRLLDSRWRERKSGDPLRTSSLLRSSSCSFCSRRVPLYFEVLVSHVYWVPLYLDRAFCQIVTARLLLYQRMFTV